MVGIRFKVRNEYNHIFSKIFENLNFDNYRWDIVEDEIYNLDGKNYFDKESYSNREFKKLVEYGTYYPVFANIQINRARDEIEDIQTYEEFISSKCQLILLITDNEFVDIYSKNEKWLNIILQNAVDNKFQDIKCIEADNSYIRHGFSAYFD